MNDSCRQCVSTEWPLRSEVEPTSRRGEGRGRGDPTLWKMTCSTSRNSSVVFFGCNCVKLF